MKEQDSIRKDVDLSQVQVHQKHKKLSQIRSKRSGIQLEEERSKNK